MNNKIKQLRQKAMKLPMTPGVYIMKNSQGKIIYIGKAKSLKNRVSQYFGSNKNHSDKVKRMVSNVDNFEYILTDSEFEALVLECSLIKQHSPKYNILLKDDKGYHYIKITSEDWPRIIETKQVLDDGAEYIGPYTSSWNVKKAVDEAQKIFMLPDCNRNFSNNSANSRPCLNYYIKQCCAPCLGKLTREQYREYIDEAIDFLKGGDAESIKKLTEQMNDAAENMEFERAARIRDRIRAIKRISDKQKVVQTNVKQQDVIALAELDNRACFEVFRFNNGRLYDKEEFLLEDVGDVNTARAEFIERYYSMRNNIPKQVTIDGEPYDKANIEQWLSSLLGSKVKIVVPKIGDQAKLVEMCKNNAMEKLAQEFGRTGKEASVLEELRQLLNLDKLPVYIESYDISNLSGTENVAGMVVFENGRPLKSAYRKFKIRGFTGQDDYQSMREVISRRFSEYQKLKDKGKGFGKLPDLILLDGGKGQVSAVLPVLESMNIDVPVYGMVKDDKHRTRAITKEGGEISISSTRKAFTLISTIQNEVHRFAISYHRQRRKNNTLSTTLTNAPGIGEKRAKMLLVRFKTLKRIKEADLEELENTPTMNRDSAIKLYDYLHNDK